MPPTCSSRRWRAARLRTIAATTFAEYKKYFEKDPALTRRFQVVQVDEPSEEKAILMMRGIASPLEKHHRVQILDEAIEAAVRLSHRYIPARQLPDKSVSLLDTAAARVAVSQHAVPAEVDDCRRRIQALETEREIIGRETAIGIDTDEREASVERRSRQASASASAGSKRAGSEEKAMVDRLLALRAQLRDGAAPVDRAQPTGAAPRRPDRAAPCSTRAARAAGRTRRAPGRSAADPAQRGRAGGRRGGRRLDRHSRSAAWSRTRCRRCSTWPSTLAKRVIGQDHGLEMIAKRVQTSRAGLDNPSKPVGVFMLCGPSGVGKTETALALAEALYGGEQNLITINMSEFQEAHTVSHAERRAARLCRLRRGRRADRGGAPQAVFRGAARRGREGASATCTRSSSRCSTRASWRTARAGVIDFKNTLILLTSNVGTDLIMSHVPRPRADAGARRDREGAARAAAEGVPAGAARAA